jgi:hypothetical protein
LGLSELDQSYDYLKAFLKYLYLDDEVDGEFAKGVNVLLALVFATESTDSVGEADFTSADDVTVVFKVGAGDAFDVVTEVEDVGFDNVVPVPFVGCVVDGVVGFDRTYTTV